MKIASDLIRTRYVGRVIDKSNFQINRKITGKISELGQVSRKEIPVILVDSKSFQVVQKTTSGVDGSYTFNWLLKQPYIVFATHPGNKFNAVIQSNVVPK